MGPAIAAMLVLGLGQGKKSPPYVGDWVTIQAAGSQGKEELKLEKDGSFTLTMSITGQPNQSAKGHYTVKAELPPGTNDNKDCTVYLQLENLNGVAVDKEKAPPKKLGYYSRGPILTDTVAIVFCHPGDQDKITKMFSTTPADTKSGG